MFPHKKWRGLVIGLVGVFLLLSQTALKLTYTLPNFKQSPFFDEQIYSFTNAAGIKILINAPDQKSFAARKKVKLVIFALPNGNTIAQTVGKQMKPGDDWHFDIQHIGAQTRFLREKFPEENIVVAYLENDLKSWPAWRRKNGDQQIPEIVESIKALFEGKKIKITLTGHSGGGSFTFGYLNMVKTIPDDVERIAFLDSNYGYETGLHKEKIVNWLKSSKQHFLTVLAYHDDIALLDGKTFVSAAGGTWGKSHLMQSDFETLLPFKKEITPEFEKYFALDRRVQFLLKENLEKKIFHTVQVEKNGFIHAMVSGTKKESVGYEYFGNRVYSKWVQPE